jgi:uncharacterized membrane protein
MQIPLKNLNVFIILGGIFLIALGYILMSTENFIDASQFSLSLYVSPPLIMVGHAVVAWGIIAGFRKPGTTAAAGDDKFEKATQG